MRTCISCFIINRIIYRGMCQNCTREFRYARYRGWIERRAIKHSKPIPREGRRIFKKQELSEVLS